MLKRLIPMLFSVVLLTVPAYAEMPEGVTITDITEQQSEVQTDFTLPQYFPTDIQTKTEDGVKLLFKTYEVAPDVLPEKLIESGLVQNETEYVLRDILRKTSPDAQENKTATQTVTVSADSDKTSDIVKLLQAVLPYSENGFTGELVLDEASISAEVESTEAYRYAVTDTRQYPGLARNDPALIAKTVQKNGMTLALCTVNWSGGSENDPAPIYNAVATYKGSASGSKPSGYLATATYSGEIVKAVPGNITYTLVYAAKPIAPIELPKGINWSLILFSLGGVVLVSGVGTMVVFLLRRRRQNPVPAFVDGLPETPKKRMYKPTILSELEDDDE